GLLHGLQHVPARRHPAGHHGAGDGRHRGQPTRDRVRQARTPDGRGRLAASREDDGRVSVKAITAKSAKAAKENQPAIERLALRPLRFALSLSRGYESCLVQEVRSAGGTGGGGGAAARGRQGPGGGAREGGGGELPRYADHPGQVSVQARTAV